MSCTFCYYNFNRNVKVVILMIDEQLDVFLSYNHKDADWVENLASLIESEKHGDRSFKVFLDEWDIIPGHNMIEVMEQGLEKSRYVCPIISKNSINAEWPNMEWSIAISSDPSGKKGRVIPIWLGDCEIPPSLKIRRVLYCNNTTSFKKSYSRLISILKNNPLSRGLKHSNTTENTFYSEQFPLRYEDDVNEQLASNLLPIISIPKIIWHGPTNYTNSKVYEFLRSKVDGTLPTFIVKEKKIFCFWNLTDKECPFRDILSAGVIDSVSVYDWLKYEDRGRWLVELLNKGLKHYCQQLQLRFDSDHRRYFFVPHNGKDRKIKWHTGKRNATRTVVKKHTRGKNNEIFWSHQTLKATFTIIDNDLFLQLVPGWTFTINGIDSLPSKQIGPLSTKWTTKEHNPSVFYHIRFWSSYLSRQSKSIILQLGNSTCEIDTTPCLIELDKGLEGDFDHVDKVFEIADNEILSTDIVREAILEEEESFEEEDSENNFDGDIYEEQS